MEIEKVKEYQDIYDKHLSTINQVQKSLKLLKKSQKEYKKLLDYYYSEQFTKDFDDSNTFPIPDGMDLGILSEDAIFDLIGENYNLGIELMEIGLKIIKDN